MATPWCLLAFFSYRKGVDAVVSFWWTSTKISLSLCDCSAS